MGSAGRYYGAYLIYDVANSCLATLHAKMPSSLDVTRANLPSPVHVQNPRKFCSKLSSSYSFSSFYISNYFFLSSFYLSYFSSYLLLLYSYFSFSFVFHWIFDWTFLFISYISNINFISFFFNFSYTYIEDKNYKDIIFISTRSKIYDHFLWYYVFKILTLIKIKI